MKEDKVVSNECITCPYCNSIACNKEIYALDYLAECDGEKLTCESCNRDFLLKIRMEFTTKSLQCSIDGKHTFTEPTQHKLTSPRLGIPDYKNKAFWNRKCIHCSHFENTRIVGKNDPCPDFYRRDL